MGSVLKVDKVNYIITTKKEVFDGQEGFHIVRADYGPSDYRDPDLHCGSYVF